MNSKLQFFGFPNHAGMPTLKDNQTFWGSNTFKKPLLITSDSSNAAVTLLTLRGPALNTFTFTMATNGGTTIAASSGGIAVSNLTDFSANGITIPKAALNLIMPSTNSLSSTTGGSIPLLAINSVQTNFRVGLGVNATGSTMSGVGDNYAAVVIGSNGVTEQSSGTHPIICNLGVRPLTITDGVAATTDATSILIEGPPTGITPTNPVTSFWIKSGRIRVDDNIAAPSTTAAGTVTNRYGGATNFLGDPTIWLRVNISGTDYKIPCYS